MEGTSQNQVKNTAFESSAAVAGHPTIKGTVIITGASGSVGKAATMAMAREGYSVIMACRNPQKAQKVRDEILRELPDAQLELMPLELSSRPSIHDFVKGLEGREIAAVFNNAGIKSHRFSRNAEGLEQNFAVNFVGNARLCLLLAPLLRPHARVVNMVSLTAGLSRMQADWQRWDEHDFGQLKTYGRSKLALLLFTIAFARHNPHLIVNVSDPGIVDSNMITMGHWYDPLADIFFRPFIKTAEQGAESGLRALRATDSLDYYAGRQHKPIASRFLRSDLPEQLYQQMLELL